MRPFIGALFSSV